MFAFEAPGSSSLRGQSLRRLRLVSVTGMVFRQLHAPKGRLPGPTPLVPDSEALVLRRPIPMLYARRRGLDDIFIQKNKDKFM